MTDGYYHGQTYVTYWPGWDGGSGSSGGGGSGGYDTQGNDTSHGGHDNQARFGNCVDKSTLSEGEREEYEVAQEAAKIAREIAAKPDRDDFEYGAIIYRGTNGLITHTPLTRGHATRVPNMSTAGMSGWGSALGVVHSHPAITYISASPYFKMHPTPPGDWDFFNAIQQLIRDDLINNHAYSSMDADIIALKFVQFIYGASGPQGSGNYELSRYQDGHESYQNRHSSEQVYYSDWVKPDLDLCP